MCQWQRTYYIFCKHLCKDPIDCPSAEQSGKHCRGWDEEGNEADLPVSGTGVEYVPAIKEKCYDCERHDREEREDSEWSLSEAEGGSEDESEEEESDGSQEEEDEVEEENDGGREDSGYSCKEDDEDDKMFQASSEDVVVASQESD